VRAEYRAIARELASFDPMSANAETVVLIEQAGQRRHAAEEEYQRRP